MDNVSDGRVAVIAVLPGSKRHARLIAEMRSEPLATQWWQDAESRYEPGEPPVSYMVTYVTDDNGLVVPAAWAGWRLDTDWTGTRLLCCDNYVRRGYRGRVPELYRLAYRARHRNVVRALKLPAVTYLFPEPVDLHLADGWVQDDSPSGSDVSDLGHHWTRLDWTPVS